MILSFEISNYRSFRDKAIFQMEATATSAKANNMVIQSLPGQKLRVLKSSLIYGANASGKTTLIMALFGLCEEASGRNKNYTGKNVPLYDPFALDSESNTKPSSMAISFIANGIKYYYSISFNSESYFDEQLYYCPNGKSKVKLFSRLKLEDGQYTLSYGPSLTAKERTPIKTFPNRLAISRFVNDIPHEKITPAAAYLANIGFANSYSPTMKERLWGESNELLESNTYQAKLKKILSFVDLGIYDFTLPKNKKFDDIELIHNVADDSKNCRITMIAESLGTETLFILGPKIIQALENGTPLIVDELDASFHSFISDFIIKMFTSERINPKHAQLIIVTHDITLMNEENLRRDQIWFAEKNKQGISEIFALSDFDGVRENTPFAKWYLASKFGAIPSISTIEQIFDERL